MEVKVIRGFIALVGPDINVIANTALRSPHCLELISNSGVNEHPFHITMITKVEAQSLTDAQKEIALRYDTHSASHRVFPLGVGCRTKMAVRFVVCVWVAGQQLRQRLGLPPKQFHITLSEEDDHTIDKGVESLLFDELSKNLEPSVLDHLVLTLQLEGRHIQALPFAVQLCLSQDSDYTGRGLIRLADSALKTEQYKLAMLAYARAFMHGQSDVKVQAYCIKKIAQCSDYTEWGTTFLDHEQGQVPEELASTLHRPWTPDLRSALVEHEPLHPPTRIAASRDRTLIPYFLTPQPSFYRLPRFFTWVVPFTLAAMSTPRNAEDIKALASPHIGIRHIVTLTEEEPLDASWFRGGRVKHTYLPVPNYDPPTIEQVDLILRLTQNESNLPILIHCGGGKGRAGTVLACYLLAYGFQPPNSTQEQPSMSPADAIAALRTIRPGSIETTQQEDFVAKYHSAIWKRNAVLPDLPPEPAPSAPEIEGTLDPKTELFVLVGLPGSGKSTFSNALLARNPNGWVHINQDDSPGRAACEKQIGHAPHGAKRVLLDRCNSSADDRGAWLALAHWRTRPPVCIFFDYRRELCESRAQNRAGHPTLRPGRRVRNAIEQMQRQFVRPTLDEGFGAVIRVTSFESVQELVLRLSPRVELLKFPRTPHFLNLGAATEDDLVHENVPVVQHGQVVITEKVDGANMGFSLSADRSQILVQNRSHYVNPSSHEQFKKLGLWVDTHRTALYTILDRDPFFAERYILYGEWLAATHSIPYTRLPNLFMAFDLYDRALQRFAPRPVLDSLLRDTGLFLVPTLHVGTMPSAEELKEMVQRPSQFYDGRIEGVYIKVEDAARVVARGKVVRHDFIAGNEHWTKGQLRFNGVVRLTE